MSIKAPSFQFYPKDWFDFKVQRMSDAAQGVYIRLLCLIWTGTETQFSIINDDKMLSKSLGISIGKWKKIKRDFQHHDDPLFQEKDGYLISKRLQKERYHQENWRTKSSWGGIMSAKIRAETKSREVQPPLQPNANTSTPTPTPTPNTINTGVLDTYTSLWNNSLTPKILTISPSRKNKLTARLNADPEFLKHFEICIQKIKETPFLRGESKGGWKASFDWLIENDKNYLKVLEGNYEKKNSVVGLMEHAARL